MVYFYSKLRCEGCPTEDQAFHTRMYQTGEKVAVFSVKVCSLFSSFLYLYQYCLLLYVMVVVLTLVLYSGPSLTLFICEICIENHIDKIVL